METLYGLAFFMFAPLGVLLLIFLMNLQYFNEKFLNRGFLALLTIIIVYFVHFLCFMATALINLFLIPLNSHPLIYISAEAFVVSTFLNFIIIKNFYYYLKNRKRCAELDFEKNNDVK